MPATSYLGWTDRTALNFTKVKPAVLQMSVPGTFSPSDADDGCCRVISGVKISEVATADPGQTLSSDFGAANSRHARVSLSGGGEGCDAVLADGFDVLLQDFRAFAEPGELFFGDFVMFRVTRFHIGALEQFK